MALARKETARPHPMAVPQMKPLAFRPGCANLVVDEWRAVGRWNSEAALAMGGVLPTAKGVEAMRLVPNPAEPEDLEK